MANITLTANQAAVLAQLGLDAEIGAEELSRKLRISARAARYAMESLEKFEVMRPQLVVDIKKLGLTRYHILFSLSAVKRKSRAQWLTQLLDSEGTIFCAEMGGRFDYQLSIAARSAEDALDNLSRLSAIEIKEKAITVRVKQSQFPRRYLSQAKLQAGNFETGKVATQVTLDSLDHELLKARAANPLASLQALASKLNAPTSTLQYRLSRLRENGVILGATVEVDCSRYGAQAYIVTLASKGFPSAGARGLFDWAQQTPHCTHIVQCLGAWDFELGIEVPNYSSLQEILDILSEKFGSALNSIEALPRYKILKYVPYPFKSNPNPCQSLENLK